MRLEVISSEIGSKTIGISAGCFAMWEVSALTISAFGVLLQPTEDTSTGFKSFVGGGGGGLTVKSMPRISFGCLQSEKAGLSKFGMMILP